MRAPAVLVLGAALPVVSGCPSDPCTGAGCEEFYGAARLDVLLGAADRFAQEVDPLLKSDGGLQGGRDLGASWSSWTGAGVLLVGMPDVATVRILLPTDLSAPEPVVRDVVEDDPSSRFGTSAILADLFGDSDPELLVSAPRAPGVGNAVEAGRVYVFDLPEMPGFAGSLPSGDARLRILGVRAYDGSGAVLARCRDLDGDGWDDLAVASPWDDAGGAPLAGSVTVVLSTRLDAEGSVALDGLGPRLAASHSGAGAGSAVACHADLTGDGVPDVAIGAPFADDLEAGLEGAGAVYVVDGQDLGQGDLEEVSAWIVRGTTAEAYLGWSVATGDVDGDGRADLAAGAPGTERGRGSVEVHLAEGAADPVGFRGEATGDRFGSAVGIADLDGDGCDDLLVGAPRHNPTERESTFAAGRLYLWYGGTQLPGWTERNEAAKAHTRFGRSQAWLQTGGSFSLGDLDGDGCEDLALAQNIEALW
ncbi:MAG: FG-GAP repeat protein [Deltaproteobacteria bacterium]|nr:FG-GAP repeat protein [Deltaproteobacteria bacterium]